MCTYYYLHYHHVHPCGRPTEYQVYYNYCVAALAAIATNFPPVTSDMSGHNTSGADFQYGVISSSRNPLGSPQMTYSFPPGSTGDSPYPLPGDALLQYATSGHHLTSAIISNDDDASANLAVVAETGATTATPSSLANLCSGHQAHEGQMDGVMPCPDSLLDTTFPSACGPGSPACLKALACTSGTCRLTDLGGRWTCCACGRGGNRYVWCANRNKDAKDTFCYHRICGTCWGDDGR